MRSVMSHQFSQVPKAEIQRSSFDRSHGYKSTFDSGYLVPVFVDEALPGDTFNLSMNALARLATPLKPIMDNLFLDSFFFAVPYRLLWENWQRFNGEQDTPGDSTDYVCPHIVANTHSDGIDSGSISDYMGLPVGCPGIQFNAFHHRAYNLIWNEWFRDQNLQDPVPIHVDDGPDPYYDYVLLKRGKRHDYFTSALPWPQKGPDVTLPLGVSAPITGNGDIARVRGQFDDGTLTTIGIGVDVSGVVTGTPESADYSAFPFIGPNTGVINPGTFTADLTSATAATINAIREAFQLQRLYERDARGGTRYTEIIRAHFGVVSPDARLQRPEYLGGGTSMINVHPVAQTSATPSSGTPQGNLSAFGVGSVHGHSFVKSFTEHCVLIGMVSVRADLTYQQGLNRMWSRKTRFDFYWPALSHLGEQAILNKEIFCQDSSHSENEAVFGYQERYAEYRYKPSQITGLFRSAAADSLDVWHLSQDFASLPVLGSDFITENPPISRVIAVSSEPQFLLDAYFQLRCARPMPVYSVPGLIDHF